MGKQHPRAGEREPWPPARARGRLTSFQLVQQSGMVKKLAAIERTEQITKCIKDNGSQIFTV